MAWACAEQLTTWCTPLGASMVSVRLLESEIHIALARINSNSEQVTQVTQLVPMNWHSLELLPKSENGFPVWQKRCWLSSAGAGRCIKQRWLCQQIGGGVEIGRGGKRMMEPTMEHVM